MTPVLANLEQPCARTRAIEAGEEEREADGEERAGVHQEVAFSFIASITIAPNRAISFRTLASRRRPIAMPMSRMTR